MSRYRNASGGGSVSVFTVLLAVGFFSCFGCCGVGLFVGMMNERAARSDLTEADKLWDAGQKEQAANKYKSLLDRDLSSVPTDSERPRVYGRVIDSEIERGNTEAAKKYIEKALDKNVDLSEAKKGAALIAQVRSQREQKEKEEQAKKQAEARRKDEEARKKREEEEARNKPVEGEYNVDGLVLLEKTVNGVVDDFTIKITGTVVNRRGKNLRYVQITYKLYDESGAQVGTALANINNLEPGGTWKFEAVGFRKAKSFKLAELKGY